MSRNIFILAIIVFFIINVTHFNFYSFFFPADVYVYFRYYDGDKGLQKLFLKIYVKMTCFQLGELILVSKPFAYVLNNDCRGQRCDYCFQKQNNLKRCSQCSFLYFCDKTCQ
ncbi:histone-lysine N-methyltransferase SMYD3, partial [Trichonephila clavata]